MKDSYLIHGGWTLITVATFALGGMLGPGNGTGRVGLLGRWIGKEAVGLGKESFASEGNDSSVRQISASSVAGVDIISTECSTGHMPVGVIASATLRVLSQSEIQELAFAATKSGSTVKRRQAFDRLLREMQSDTFTVEQAMTMRSSLHENGANGEQWRIFDYAWGVHDPHAALAHVAKIGEKYRQGFTGNMLPGLASVEPQLAVDLVSTMEGRKKFHMTQRLIEGLADYDVQYATNYVQELADNGSRGASHHVKRLASEVLSTAGFEEGVEWAENLDPGQVQANALWRVANEYTNQDPHGAANWATQFVGHDQNSRLFGEVVREWGDVDEATSWVNSLEPSLARRDALSAVYGFRGSQEPHEAVQDIMDMPVSDDRNFAINGFISGLAHQDGEAAVAWAAEITDQGMRQAAQVRAGQKYFQQNQEAATQWFADSGLPETAWNQVAK